MFVLLFAVTRFTSIQLRLGRGGVFKFYSADIKFNFILVKFLSRHKYSNDPLLRLLVTKSFSCCLKAKKI